MKESSFHITSEFRILELFLTTTILWLVLISVSASQNECSIVNINSFFGCYYDNIDFINLKVTRTENRINFDLGLGSPDLKIGVNTFSARWQGIFNFDAGEYEFIATADDGVRLYIDDKLLLNKWFDQSATTYTVRKILTKGLHEVKMEYYENNVFAVAKLSWNKILIQPSLAIGKTATLYLNPSSKSVQVGDTFPVEVRLNTNGQVVAVSAYLNFDTSKLEVVSIDSSSSAFGIEAEGLVSGSLIKIARGQQTPGVTGNVLVTKINFRAKSAGTATVNFVLTSLGQGPSRVILDDGLGTDILTSVTNGVYTIGITTTTTIPVTTTTTTSLPCIRSNPTVIISPPSITAKAGTTVTYSVSVTNNDVNCGLGKFILTRVCPSGWGCLFLGATTSLSLTIPSGSTLTTTLNVISSITTTPGTYTISVTATGPSGLSHTGSANYIVSTTTTTVPTTTTTTVPTTTTTKPPTTTTTTPGLYDSGELCLDDGFNPSTLLSKWVVAIQNAGRSTTTTPYYCGASGYYSVSTGASGEARLTVQTPSLPRSGKYQFTIVYRIGSPGQNNENMAIDIGGQTLNLRDGVELQNTEPNWAKYVITVNLNAGVNQFVIRGTGTDSVHIEAFRLVEISSTTTTVPGTTTTTVRTTTTSTTISTTTTTLPAGRAASLFLTPSSKSVQVGDIFPVEVRLNTNNNPVVAVSAYLNFDTSKLEFVSIDSSNSVFSVKAEEVVSGTLIKIGRGQQTPGVTGNVLVTKVNFRAKAAGTATVNFVLTSPGQGPSRVILDDGLGTDILTSVTNGVYTILTTTTTIPTTTTTSLPCTRSNPTVTISPSSITAKPGTTVTYSVSVKNNDMNCGLGKFTLTRVCPLGWACLFLGAATSTSLTIQSGSTVTTKLNVISSSATTSGTYTISVTATGPTGLSHTGSASYIVGISATTTTTQPTTTTTIHTQTTTTAPPTTTTLPQGKAGLFLIPASKSVQVGDIFPVEVRLNTNNNPVVAVSAYLNFDTTKLEVVSIDSSNSAFSVTAEEKILGNKIQIGRGQQTPGVTGSNVLVTIVNFRAKAAGTATVNFVLTSPGQGPSRVILDDGLGTDILTSVTNGVYTITSQPSPPTPPRKEDINKDGRLDIVDIITFINNWHKRDPSLDLNEDGVVDIYDFAILLSNMGIK